MKFLRRLVLGIIVVSAAVYGFRLWEMRDPHPAERVGRGAIAIQGARIYTSPDAPPIEHGTVVVRDGVTAAVGPDVKVPSDAQLLPCNACTVTAGFWNTHVHFTERKWDSAAWKDAATLNAQLADMLTSRGFTTVVDAGSDLAHTVSLRRRIERGELLGPKIYTAGSGLYPPHGIPYYLKNSLPFFDLWALPMPNTPEEAAKDEERSIARGADLLKLFTGSYVERGKVLPMPKDIAAAAVRVAHDHGHIAYSHPSNLAGTQVAIASGVDVLAHAPDSTEGVDAALLGSMVTRHMAMIPTLKMFATTVTNKPEYLMPIYAEVRQFHELGGTLMFGTDVGYMTDYSTEDEFLALKQSGLNMQDVLRMLTTAPAERFGVADKKGSIAIGKAGDLAVLDADPAQNVTAFAHVSLAVRNGIVIYEKK